MRRAVLVALVVLAGAAVAACGTADLPTSGAALVPPPPVGTTVGGWTRLPDPPLTARRGAVAVWTGDEVVIVGGSTSPPCPGDALCAADPVRTDGAAYDPSDGSWRPIADAPVALSGPSAGALGGDVYLLAGDWGDGSGDRFVRYDPESDVWTELPAPTRAAGRRLLAWGDTLVAVVESAQSPITVHEVWEPDTESWAPLEVDSMPEAHYRFGFTAGEDLYVETIRGMVRHDGTRWVVVDTGSDGATCDDLTSSVADGAGRVAVLPRTDAATLCVHQGGSWAGVGSPSAAGVDSRVIEFPLIGDHHVALGVSVYEVDSDRWEPLEAPDTLRREQMAAVWAGDQLFTFGGVDGSGDPFGDAALRADAWLWTAQE